MNTANILLTFTVMHWRSLCPRDKCVTAVHVAVILFSVAVTFRAAVYVFWS